MKFLTRLKQDYKSKEYSMTIVDSENPKDQYNGPIDIKKLKECTNIKVKEKKYKSASQNPTGYITTDMNLDRINGFNERYFVSNIYCNENGDIELIKTISTENNVQIRHISELENESSNNQYIGEYYMYESFSPEIKCLTPGIVNPKEKIPDYVQVQPLSKAYEWWKERDHVGEGKDYFRELSERRETGAFITSKDTSTKLFMHYLTGVKGFKVASHTSFKAKGMAAHGKIDEYTLYNGASIVSLNINNYLGDYNPHIDIQYHSDLNYNQIFKDDSSRNDGIIALSGDHVALSVKESFVRNYNLLEKAATIEKDFKLFDNYRFGEYSYLIPGILYHLPSNLDAEKSGNHKPYTAVLYNSDFSTLDTSEIMHLASLYVSLQTCSKDFKAIVEPQMKEFDNKWKEALAKLINNIGLQRAEETLRWTKENLKEELKDIQFENEKGGMQQMDISIVDKLDNYLQIKRNDYSPKWLQKFGESTIEALGGIDILHQLIEKRGEEFAEKSVNILAYGIEDEAKEKMRSERDFNYVKADELIIDNEIEDEAEAEME